MYVCENICERTCIYLDRAEDIEVVCDTVQSHLTKLIGHHHCNSIKETIQVFKWDLFSSISLKEDVLYLWQPPAMGIAINHLNYYYTTEDCPAVGGAHTVLHCLSQSAGASLMCAGKIMIQVRCSPNFTGIHARIHIPVACVPVALTCTLQHIFFSTLCTCTCASQVSCGCKSLFTFY